MGYGKEILNSEVLNAFFTLVFIGKINLPRPVENSVWNKKNPPMVEKDQYLNKLEKNAGQSHLTGCTQESWGSWIMSHLRPTSTIFERLWWLKAPQKWKKANVFPIFEKGKDQGNYRLVSLTSTPGKMMISSK